MARRGGAARGLLGHRVRGSGLGRRLGGAGVAEELGQPHRVGQPEATFAHLRRVHRVEHHGEGRQGLPGQPSSASASSHCPTW